MLLSNPSLYPHTVTTPVQTMQVAPTILQALGLDPNALQSVALEGTQTLPGAFSGNSDKRSAASPQERRDPKITKARRATPRFLFAHRSSTMGGKRKCPCVGRQFRGRQAQIFACEGCFPYSMPLMQFRRSRQHDTGPILRGRFATSRQIHAWERGLVAAVEEARRARLRRQSACAATWPARLR